ncbi:vWA domain-containing protein [Bacillus salipaludis]|uniref:vWA domain-containing protein n=1 Tax=Bacillus salipaludis TaxID=2547811 RepID=UPI001F275036|nr:VWA domain-containing protein [Bacillus salipaludis]
MKKDLTELVFILDKSGSMAGLEADTIGGYNAMLKKQLKAEGEAVVTTVLFDHDIELLHDRIHVKGISPITDEDYDVGGTTALLDAIGLTIQKIVKVQKKTMEEERAEKVLFVITTDGMENASREFSREKI